MMTLEQARTIKPGDRLRVLVGGIGGVGTDDGGEEELTFAAGEIVRVAQVDNFPAPQGFAITVVSDNGVVNVFDESDFDRRYPFAPPLMPGERVVVTKPVDNYPTVVVGAGETGTLQRIDEEGTYWVKLDKPFPALEEWANEVAIWDWSKEGGQIDDHPAAFLAPVPAAAPASNV